MTTRIVRHLLALAVPLGLAIIVALVPVGPNAKGAEPPVGGSTDATTGIWLPPEAELKPIDGYVPDPEVPQEKRPTGVLRGQNLSHVVLVAARGATVRNWPADDAPVRQVNVEFGQAAAAFGIRDKFVLLAEWKEGKPGGYIGWIHRDHVLLSAECLKVVRDEKTGQIHRVDRRDGLLAKAVPVNVVDRLVTTNGNDPDERRLDVVPARFAPRSDATKRADLKLSDFYFVWKEARDAENCVWLLLGIKGGFNSTDPQAVAGEMVGWVEASRAAPWNTHVVLEENTENRDVRMAINKPDPTVPGRKGAAVVIYETEDDIRAADEALSTGVVPKGKKINFSFVENPLSPPKSHSEPRYLLLREFNLDPANPFSPRVAEMFVWGDMLLPDGRRVSNQDLDRLKQYLTRLEGRSKVCEIVIVVDDTGSAAKHYAAVANAVIRLQEQAVAEFGKNIELRWKLVKVRDFTEERKPNSFVVRSSSRKPSADTKLVLDMLSEKAVGEGEVGGGPYEALFYGIRQALPPSAKCDELFGVVRKEQDDDEANADILSPNSHRVLIVIGDAGSHLPDGFLDPKKYAADADPITHAVRLDEVTKILKELGVDFHAISTVANPTEGSAEAAFHAQMNEIIKQLGNGPHSFSVLDPKQDTAKLICEKMSSSFTLNKREREMIAQVLRGELPADKLPEEVKTAVRAGKSPSSAALSIDAAAVERLLGRKVPDWLLLGGANGQLSKRGFAFITHPWDGPDGKPLTMLRRRVMVNRVELQDLNALLRKVTERDSGRLPEQFIKGIETVYERKDEVQKGKSPGFYMEKFSTLPPQNRLLNVPFEKLADPEVQKQLLPYLSALVEITDAVYMDCPYKVTERDASGFPIKVVKTTNERLRESRWFKRDTWEFAYLDIGELP